MHTIEVGFIYSKFLHVSFAFVAFFREVIRRIKSYMVLQLFK